MAIFTDIFTDTQQRPGLRQMLEDIPDLRPERTVPFRPVLDRILVEEIPVEESRIVTPGGGLKLERSERFEAKPMSGKVLAVGDGVPMAGVLMPMPYKPGQVVRCSEYGREYINLRTGQNGVNAFHKDEKKTYLIIVSKTYGSRTREKYF